MLSLEGYRLNMSLNVCPMLNRFTFDVIEDLTRSTETVR